MPIAEQDLDAIARAVHERSVQSGSETLPLGLAVGLSTAYGKRIEEAIAGLPAAVADAVIARLPGSSPDAALIRQIVAEELTKLQLTTVATAQPTPTP
jgi:hypothetical protein